MPFDFDHNMTHLNKYDELYKTYLEDLDSVKDHNKKYEEWIELPEDQREGEKLELKDEPVAPSKPEVSSYELSSVGRMYFNLTKVNAPERWRRIVNAEFGVKKSNM